MKWLKGGLSGGWRAVVLTVAGMSLAGLVLPAPAGAAVAAGVGMPGTHGTTPCTGPGDFSAQYLSSAWPGGFTGVPVYSNGSGTYVSNCYNHVTTPSGSTVESGMEWQCVELANRLYLTKGWISATWTGDGDQLYSTAPSVGLTNEQRQGSITYLAPGDVISFTGPISGGHAAVVSAVSGSSITLVNQNTGSSSTLSTGTLRNGSLIMNGWAGYTPIGVIHAPGGGGSFEGYESAFQANTGSLYVYGDILNANLQQGMAPGTSPAVAVFPNGGYETAFQANTGDLFVYGDDGSADLRLGMMPGTSPAIAASPNGGFQVAFQANTGDLYTYTSGVGATNWQLGMAPGTSPAIAALPGGGYEEAFQANTHNLWAVGDGGTVGDTKLGMMPGTSPSIAASPRGGFRVAFQANTSSLYTYTSGSGAINWQLGMDTGSSPAVAALAGGGYEEAFQANTHNLWIVGDGGTVGDTRQGMLPETSPAIAASPAGGFRAAFQANTGNLYDYSSGTGPVDLQQGMLGRTSPCIASASGGGCAPGSSDVTPPTVSMGPLPTATLLPAVSLSWSAADGGADLASYDVRWRRAKFSTKFGSWRYPSRWQGTTSTSGRLGASPGFDYCVQVRARDWGGNVSGWSGQQCVARALDDRALAAGPGWSRRTGSGYYLRTYTVTRRARRVLTLARAELDRVGLVATKCPSCGKVALYVGSRRIGVISLSARTTARAQVIMLPPFAHRRGRVTIKTLSAGRTVQIDGLVISTS